MSEADELNTIVAEWVEKAEADLDTLTPYATATRYPGGLEPTLGQARAAVRMARRVRKEVRRRLPRGRSVGGEGDGPSKDRQLIGDPSEELNVLMRLMLGRYGQGKE